MPISEYLMQAFTILVVLQIFFPLLAYRIKNRFKKIGYEMNAEPMWSVLNVSKFWYEAKEKNKIYKDPVVSNLLYFHTVFWLFAIVVFILGIVVTIVAPI
jgi:hypothetical protein